MDSIISKTWRKDFKRSRSNADRTMVHNAALIEYLHREEADEKLPEDFNTWFDQQVKDAGNDRKLILTPASAIKSKRQRWLWENKIPLGTLTLFAGRGGEGKSSFALWVASNINAGLLNGDLQGVPGSVLIISHEDNWSTVMKLRLEAAGANQDQIFKLEVESTTDEITLETVPVFPMDLELIREAVEKTGAVLIIADPIVSSLMGDLHKVVDVRRGLDPLAELAQELDIAIIGIMHFNKGQGNVSDKLSGSHAFRDAVRSVMLFATDEDTGQRVVTIDKNNYSQSTGDSFAFTLDSVQVFTDDGEPAEVAQVNYLGETDVSVSEIINRQPGDEGQHEDRSVMERHIYEYLFESGGSAEAKDVIRSGQAQGFKEPDLKKARYRMRNPKVITQRLGFGKGAKYVWALDSPMDSMHSKGTDPGTHGTHEESMTNTLATVTPIGRN